MSELLELKKKKRNHKWWKDRKDSDGLVKGVKVSATAGVIRCMFTLY